MSIAPPDPGGLSGSVYPQQKLHDVPVELGEGSRGAVQTTQENLRQVLDPVVTQGGSAFDQIAKEVKSRAPAGRFCRRREV